MSETPSDDHVDVDALFDTAAGEDAALDDLETAIEKLRAAQRAKATLFSLPPATLAESAFKRRRPSLRIAGESA